MDQNIDKCSKCLETMRSELLRQAESHQQAARSRTADYKNTQKPEILHDALRLSFTAEALANVSNALTPDRVEKWQSEHSVIPAKAGIQTDNNNQIT